MNTEIECDEILQQWPNYNLSQKVQNPFVVKLLYRKNILFLQTFNFVQLKLGEIDNVYQKFLKAYEAKFHRRAEILLIAALRKMMDTENFTYGELDPIKANMVEMVIKERRTIQQKLISDLILHFKNTPGFHA